MIALGATTLAAGIGLATLAAPAAFAGVDGGGDMNAACVNQYGPGAAAAAGYNVYDWVCVRAGLTLILGGINVQEQCNAQYGPGRKPSSLTTVTHTPGTATRPDRVRLRTVAPPSVRDY